MDPPSEQEDTMPASPELIMPFYVLVLTQDMDLSSIQFSSWRV